MDKVAVIVNPASRNGRAMSAQQLVAGFAARDGRPVFQSASKGHAKDIARNLVDQGYERVIAVGGDGTLSEVANGLAFSETALAAVPLGTGNDWVRTVGVPVQVEQAWRIATQGRVMSCDLAEVDGHGYCLNVLGAGFDAEVARRIAAPGRALRHLGPKPRYIASVLSTIVGYKPPSLSVSVDGAPPRTVPRALLLAVGVAQFYGSGMRVLPDALIDDGLLDVVWGRDIHAAELPSLLSQIFKGRHTSHKKVESFRCQSITIESDALTPFHIDGDVRGELPITVTVRPKALRIVVP